MTRASQCFTDGSAVMAWQHAFDIHISFKSHKIYQKKQTSYLVQGLLFIVSSRYYIIKPPPCFHKHHHNHHQKANHHPGKPKLPRLLQGFQLNTKSADFHLENPNLPDSFGGYVNGLWKWVCKLQPERITAPPQFSQLAPEKLPFYPVGRRIRLPTTVSFFRGELAGC